MMKKIILLLFVLPTILCSQKINNLSSFRSLGNEAYFRFHYDNDFFAASDKNYTQGYSFELANSAFAKNPINYIFIPQKQQKNIYGIAIEHIGYTPSNFVSTDIQLGDRPFAAAIYVKSFSIITDRIKKRRLAQSLSIGLIGPGAFGKEIQTKIHELTGNKIPGGWDNQIQNDVVLNYMISIEKQLYRYNSLFSLQSVATIQLGTLFTNASVGLNTSFGLIDFPFHNSNNISSFKIYMYAQPIVSIIGYDATLQGGILTNDNPYTTANGQLERITGQIDFGLILKYNRLYLEYSRSVITREFKTGTTAKWGGFKVGHSFN